MKDFKVSVITPVYNAAKFIQNAVESAVNLPEVGEVILVEDGSPDNALEICRRLENKYEKVKLYQHPNGENRGAGASRNLGIEKTTFDFIAFLDADDWYLPNRFEAEKKLFDNPEVDGVYGATGFYNQNTERVEEDKLTTFSKKLKPSELLSHYISFKGRFTTDAVTIRKGLLKRSGFFKVQLKLHQDTHLWYRLAYYGKLYPGLIDKPIAMRRVHENNRITKKSRHGMALFHEEVFKSLIDLPNIDDIVVTKITKRYLISQSSNVFELALKYGCIFMKYPHILRSHLKFKNLS